MKKVSKRQYLILKEYYWVKHLAAVEKKDEKAAKKYFDYFNSLEKE